MEYKLLRALSIFLQAGLVLLVIMLISLFFVSCTTATVNNTSVKLNAAARKDIMEQRFLNEMHRHRQQFKVLCSTQEIINTKQLSNTQRFSNGSLTKKA